jgi:pre-60S factor REI1
LLGIKVNNSAKVSTKAEKPSDITGVEIKSVNKEPNVVDSDNVLKVENNDHENSEDLFETIEEPSPLLGPNISIFDDKVFETTEDCIQYMALNFGFFIPDIEFLIDLDGLLNYLGEKVKKGGYCLYCQKRCSPGRSCQNHMISKSHCKIAYENGIDGDEFEDFYDFSASYEDVEDDDDVEVDEDGNIEGNQMHITPIGELVLPNGRKVGHRAYRLYYKQRFAPEDNRPSIIAQQREELLRLENKFGGTKRMELVEMNKLTDTDIMTMIIKYQKDIRKGQIIEQKSQQRRERIDQRREYKSTVDKLRSSATTTAKIRDYHKIL